MPRNSTSTPRVPGEPVAEATTETTAADQQDVGETVATPVEAVTEAAAEETVTVSKSSLDALIARVNALESKAKSPVTSMAVDVELPDQTEIDQATITKPVLTKQGWVVPEKFGSNPNAPKAF